MNEEERRIAEENRLKSIFKGEIPQTEIGKKLLKIISNDAFNMKEAFNLEEIMKGVYNEKDGLGFGYFTMGWVECIRRLEVELKRESSSD